MNWIQKYFVSFGDLGVRVSVWLVVSLDMKKMELLVDKGRNLRLGVRYT